MASTRTIATKPPTTAFVTLVRRGARIQIAACTTAANTLVQWAQSADRLAQAVGDGLLRRVDGESDSAALAACLTEASATHLRELTALPRAAADHFDTRLARVSNDN